MNPEEIREILHKAQQDHLLQIGKWATLIAQEFGPEIEFGRIYHPSSWPTLVSVEILAYVCDQEVAHRVFDIRVRDVA
jgi:hypothetical protein